MPPIPHRFDQPLRGETQRFVTMLVPETFIERAKLIDIDEKDCGGLILVERRKRCAQAVDEPIAVGQSSQLVGMSQEVELFLRSLAIRNIDNHRNHSRPTATKIVEWNRRCLDIDLRSVPVQQLRFTFPALATSGAIEHGAGKNMK